MNNEQIFQLGLGLVDPWVVVKSELVMGEDGKELHLHLGYRKDYFVDGSGKSNVHDRVKRTWRHLNFFEHKCYLHCGVPRILGEDGKVRQVAVPWAREGSGFTLLFEAFTMFLIEQEMPVNKVGKTVSVWPKRIWTVFNYWIGRAYAKADHAGIEVLGIDETSSKRGHDYVTLAVDMKTSRVVHATQGKGAETITAIAGHLQAKGTPPEAIKQVCIDLSPAFISGVGKEFPQANIVFDRFHVKALLNKAMDDVRKQEVKKHAILKGQKYIFLKSEKNLLDYQVALRDLSLETLPRLGEAAD